MTQAIDNFNSIIIERVMACRNHNAAVKALCAHHIRNAGCCGYMKQICICAGSCDSCCQSVLKHIAASSCIFTDHNLCLVISSIVPAQVSSDLEGMLYSQFHICLPAEAVCTEIFSHNILLLTFAFGNYYTK